MGQCVNVSTPQNVARLNKAIEDRARELGLTFNEVARRSGKSTETLMNLRGKGKKRSPDSRPYDSTFRGVDHALQWPEGTTAAIWDGRDLPDGGGDPAIAEIEATSLSREQKDILISVLKNARAGVLQQAREMEAQQKRGA
jgi:hypothetical protein